MNIFSYGFINYLIIKGFSSKGNYRFPLKKRCSTDFNSNKKGKEQFKKVCSITKYVMLIIVSNPGAS